MNLLTAQIHQTDMTRLELNHHFCIYMKPLQYIYSVKLNVAIQYTPLYKIIAGICSEMDDGNRYEFYEVIIVEISMMPIKC